MISTTGRMPCIAAPIPAPTSAISEIGVLLTRSGPNSASIPRRTRHPPLLSASSPPLRHPHRPAPLGDVLAHDEDVVVAAHRGRERVADGLAVAQLSHRCRRS